MPFVSYAQNFEDLMLWRALGHVDAGFYVDVGALSPDFDTVTRAFYERGWRGLNIEPNPDYLAELRRARPEDRNLGVAISDTAGRVSFNLLDNPGLSTMVPEIAEAHRDAGMPSRVIDTEAWTLADLWKAEVSPGQEVHFLKIDVEGHEGAVVRGGDWTTCRPWILVIEATYPNSQTLVHEDWEGIVLEAGYRLVYWDGLNRFYLSPDHLDLEPAFAAPPNVFDDYELSRYAAPLADLKGQLDAATGLRDAALSARDAADAANRDTTRAYEHAVETLRSSQRRCEDLERLRAEEAGRVKEVSRSLDVERQVSSSLEYRLGVEGKTNRHAIAGLEQRLATESKSNRQTIASLESRLAAEHDARATAERTILELRNLRLSEVVLGRLRDRLNR